MVLKKYFLTCCIAVVFLFSPLGVLASENYSVQLYFGLSVPEGKSVTPKQWNQFVADSIAKRFDGFNVVDSLGYWKGKPENSKIVTIILKEDQVHQAEVIAKEYAKLFHQDSVMLVQSSIEKWEFLSGK